MSRFIIHSTYTSLSEMTSRGRTEGGRRTVIRRQLKTGKRDLLTVDVGSLVQRTDGNIRRDNNRTT